MRRAVCGAAILAGLAAATPGWAECPQSPRDLDAGIVVVYADGATTRYRAGPGLRMAEDMFFDAGFGQGYRLVTLAGVVPLDAVDFGSDGIDEGTRTRTALDVADAAFPVLAPGLDWSVGATVAEAGGARFRQTLTLRAEAAATRAYGPCVYPALPLTLHFLDEDGGSTDRFDYLLPLGIAVWLGNTPDGGEWDRLVPVSISRILPPGMPEFD